MIKYINCTRSCQSILLENLIRLFPLAKDERKKKNFDQAMIVSQKEYLLPKIVQKKFNIHQVNDIDNTTFVILPQNNKFAKTIFYLHGGAYWWQPVYLHFKMLQKIADQNNARVIVPIYPKSPGYTADTVLPYILNNYKKAIQKLHIMSSALTLMGDSAGGGLCLSLLQLLENEEIEKPSQVILFSPWLDLSNSNLEMIDIQPKDPLLNIQALRYQGEIYSGSLDEKAPLVSPINANFDKFPPLSIFCGTHDILYADIKKLSQKSNKNINSYIFPKMNHVFVAFPIPEAKKALNMVSQILNKQLPML